MVPKFEYVIKPLEVKKRNKKPNSDKKTPLPSKQNNLLRNSAKTLHNSISKGEFVCAVSLLINTSFWSMVSVCVSKLNQPSDLVVAWDPLAVAALRKGVGWTGQQRATEWQAVHVRFPRRTERMAPGCKRSSDNVAALLLSLFTSGCLKDGLICPYDLLYDFTASYTYLFFHLYAYICMKIP